MFVDNLLDESSETNRNEVFCNALKLVGDMEIKPVCGESWFDDLNDIDYDGPEDETQIGESWMDDLDEAA